MFGRFMIVCWVLFSFFAGLAAVGGAVVHYLASEIEATDTLLSELPKTTAKERLDEIRADKDSAIRKAAREKALQKAQIREKNRDLAN